MRTASPTIKSQKNISAKGQNMSIILINSLYTLQCNFAEGCDCMKIDEVCLPYEVKKL